MPAPARPKAKTPQSVTTNQPNESNAIISGGKGTAADKMAALESAGVTVVKNPAEIGEAVKSVLS